MYMISGIQHTPYTAKQLQVVKPNEKLPDKTILEKPKKEKKIKEDKPKKKPVAPKKEGETGKRNIKRVDYKMLDKKGKK